MQLLQNFFANVVHNPVFLLSFIVPILLLLFSSIAIRMYSKRAKIDGPPTLEQKKEKFIIPKDFFNREVERVQAEDYVYFLRPLSNEFSSLRLYHDNFKILEKQYKRYVAMSHSARKKRRTAGEEGRKKTFNDILNLYNRLRNTRFDVVEFEQEDERIL